MIQHDACFCVTVVLTVHSTCNYKLVSKHAATVVCCVVFHIIAESRVFLSETKWFLSS